MPRRRMVLVGLVCLAVAALLVASLPDRKEPRYKGRRLSQWIALYSENLMTTEESPDFEESKIAVQAIGTNALPFLVNWIQQEPPRLGSAIQKHLPSGIANTGLGKYLIFGTHHERATHATIAFYILSSNAAPAIPALTSLMKDSTHPTTARNAINALGGLGAAGFPHLVVALADTNQIYRSIIAVQIGGFLPQYVGTNVCLAPLRAALADPDASTRSMAVEMLNRLSGQIPTNAPAQ